jgi:hypothetical protein
MSGGGDFEAEGFINCENEINVLKVINYGKVTTTFLESVRLPGLSSLHAVITKGVGPSTTSAWPGYRSSLIFQWKWTRSDLKLAVQRRSFKEIELSRQS